MIQFLGILNAFQSSFSCFFGCCSFRANWLPVAELQSLGIKALPRASPVLLFFGTLCVHFLLDWVSRRGKNGKGRIFYAIVKVEDREHEEEAGKSLPL